MSCPRESERHPLLLAPGTNTHRLLNPKPGIWAIIQWATRLIVRQKLFRKDFALNRLLKPGGCETLAGGRFSGGEVIAGRAGAPLRGEAGRDSAILDQSQGVPPPPANSLQSEKACRPGSLQNLG